METFFSLGVVIAVGIIVAFFCVTAFLSIIKNKEIEERHKNLHYYTEEQIFAEYWWGSYSTKGAFTGANYRGWTRGNRFVIVGRLRNTPEVISVVFEDDVVRELPILSGGIEMASDVVLQVIDEADGWIDARPSSRAAGYSSRA